MTALVIALLFASDGAHRVPTEHTLRNVESLGAYKLYLVTMDHAKPDEVSVVEGIGNGPLALPDGEGLVSRLFALSESEVRLYESARERNRLASFFAYQIREVGAVHGSRCPERLDAGLSGAGSSPAAC